MADSSTSRSEHDRTLLYNPLRNGRESCLPLPPVNQASRSSLSHSGQVIWLPVLSHERIPEHVRYPVKCALCSGVYERYYMPAHERTHTGEQPFQCPICPRRFSMKGGMKKHVVKVHKITNPYQLEILIEQAIMEFQHP
ncbi:unnamed protein product [Gongylonema pulchrum]|uniref:C2H2-type domain-containing protein n=1 Tax=Gongylonema pulchrum TaxID=637853 RepID=A0A3P6R963_9BILA|nr:unnamed protein product [Gongylonema pulchrum]